MEDTDERMKRKALLKKARHSYATEDHACSGCTELGVNYIYREHRGCQT